MSWPVVKLGDICDLFNGYAFKSADYMDESNTLSCRMSNIRPGGKFDIEYNARYLPDDFVEKYEQFLLKDGDVVIAMTDLADSPKILGVPTIIKTNGRKILLNQRVGKLIIKERNKVHFPYLQIALNSSKVRSIYKRFAGGGLQINLGKADLLSVEIPLPPLAEQQKIASILDAADSLRQKDHQLIEKYTALSQSLFLEMFGDPVSNPMGWQMGTSIQYCECIVPGRDKPKSFSGYIPWVTTNDLNRLTYTSKSKKDIGLTEEEVAEVRAKIIPENSVILTCVGDLGVISINSSPVVINQQLHAFQCDHINISPIFMMYVLSYQTPYMYKMASSTTVPYMNKTVCNNIPMIYPSITLQNQFAERILAIEAQKLLAQASLQKSAALFNSLLQRAFKGELTT